MGFWERKIVVSDKVESYTGTLESNGGRRRHIAGLDALRALAITLITFFHVCPDVFVGGYIGVCLFLVLTGFLLAYGSVCDYMAESFSVRCYYFKRLKRLYPPLVFVVLLTVGVYHFMLPEVLEDSGKEIVSIFLGVNNWWQLAMNADYFARVINASPFTHMWFLGVELEYVVLWPLLFGLCVLLKRWKGGWILCWLGMLSAGLMTMGALYGADVSRLYYGTDTRIFACLFGSAMGMWFTKREVTGRCSRHLAVRGEIFVGVLLIPVLEATFLLNGQDMFLYVCGMQLLTVLFCLMLLAVIDLPQFGNRLEKPVFQWIGQHSYEIFLWQYPVLFLSQRTGWHELSYGPLGDIVMILLLAACTKAILELLGKPKTWFSRGGVKECVKRYTVAMTAVFSIVLIGFGTQDILASDFDPNHQPGYKLKQELEQKQTELKNAQAERAAREVEEAQKIKTEQERQAARLRGAGVTMIGDSVMVGASPAIAKLLPEAYIDALSCRDVCGGYETAQKLGREGKLGDVVVVALGTNGPLLKYEPYASGMQNLLKVLGTERQIFWITTYCSYSQWMTMNNKYLAELEQARPNFHRIDWYPLARSNPGWLYSDGTHPNIKGAEQYAKLIHDTLTQALSN